MNDWMLKIYFWLWAKKLALNFDKTFVLIINNYFSSLKLLWKLFFILPLYSGSEVWEGIWNQTHLVTLNFRLERLHRVTISHHKARSNREYQYGSKLSSVARWKYSIWKWISVSKDYTTLPNLKMRHAQTVGVNDLSCLDLDPFCLSLHNSQLILPI